MAINHKRIIEASLQAAKQPLRVIGIVLYKGRYYALAGEAGTLAAAAGEAHVANYATDSGFFGDVPWFAISSHSFDMVERVLRNRGLYPSVLEIDDEPAHEPEVETEPDPFDDDATIPIGKMPANEAEFEKQTAEALTI